MSTQEFNTLLINNSGVLVPFAITLTRDHESARDLCQETLCKALVYKDNYNTGTNIKAWLYTIMRNIFINNYHREKRKKLMMDTVSYSEPKQISNAGENVLTKEINEAIHSLPPTFKMACLLYFEGHKYQEIAEALNEPLGTIKSRIHFARKLLQKKIDR